MSTTPAPALFDLEDFGLRIEPTGAMRAGHQVAHQCSWCGGLVVWNEGVYRETLGICPACGRESAGWWQQDLPVAGVHEHDHEWGELGAVEMCSRCGKTRVPQTAVSA